MSRSQVAKSRADHKGGGRPTANTPAVTQEIVPGKYNDHDWNFMLDADDGDDFVLDIVNNICESAVDIIFKDYIQRQLVPYTVVQAKDAILQIIEWQFLARDEGETDPLNDSSWLEDEEPSPSVADCWAQGAVPRQPVGMLSPPPIQEEEPAALDQSGASPELEEELSDICQKEGEGSAHKAEEEEEALPDESLAMGEVEEGEDSLPAEESIVSLPEGSTAYSETTTQQQTEPTSQENTTTSLRNKQKKKYKPHAGPLKSPNIRKMTESLEQMEMRLQKENESQVLSTAYSPDPAMLVMPSSCHSIIKLQAGRPPGNRDVVYDEQGNVVSVTKLDPDRLPSHKVKTGYRVIDPGVEAAQAQLEAMRTGRYLRGTVKHGTQSPDSPRSFTSKTTAAKGTLKSKSTPRPHHSDGHTTEGINPLPPPLIESMDVSPGVVVREGERVKHGPRQHPRRAELIATTCQRGLRPLTMRTAVPTISVSDLLERHTPVLKPLVDSPPIPPISATPINSQ